VSSHLPPCFARKSCILAAFPLIVSGFFTSIAFFKSSRTLLVSTTRDDAPISNQRLALAVQKTTTVDQRSLVVAAVVIPKLLYIGRHQWPTMAIVERFQKCIHNYIWHAQFTHTITSGRAWMNATVAALPRIEGGIAAPSIKLELLAMAADTVANWAHWSTPE
jgi:hypothetical protein